MAERRRILTGDRPTGKLHLGHYVGTLANRVRLQHEYDCFIFAADIHALTTSYEDPRSVNANVQELVLDYLAVGLDPNVCTIYVQSAVIQVGMLNTILGMLAQLPRLQRVPTLKETVKQQHLTTVTLGLVSYPVLQSADILIVRGEVVPVGKDQASHLEVSRELASRFNLLYRPVFPEPEALIGDVPTLTGTDGKAKMSKSLGNAIFLSDPPEVVEQKVRGMYTDPTRLRATDPGHVEGNPVFEYHDAFNSDRAEVEELKERYRAGRVGDVEVKKRLIRALNEFLDPIRERRAKYEGSALIAEILVAGGERARREAAETMEQVRDAMGLTYLAVN
ncbi:MAG: tryptophan--tRNA ligase [Chloroflexi bacterium]|nr:tryptophan--tRNA ligase [Chloroflexota bacterium]